MMGPVKISVVLPVYNVESYIERCVDSLLNQKDPGFEMIFVDDCGDDESIKIVSRFSRSDPRIKVIHNPRNMGTYHARKVGVENARGDYVIFLDPDDTLRNDAIGVLSESANTNADVIFYGSKTVPKPKPWQGSAKVPILSKDFKDRNECISSILNCDQLSFGIEGKMFKRQLLLSAHEELGVPDDERLIYAEDTLLLFSALMNLQTAISVGECLYFYHKNPSSITVNASDEIVSRRVEGLQVLASIIENHNKNVGIEKYIKEKFTERVGISLLKQKIKSEKSFFSCLFCYYKLVCMSRSLRDAVKLCVYLASISRIKL